MMTRTSASHERVLDFLDAGIDSERGVEGDDVVEILREALLALGHQFADGESGLDGIASGRLIDGEKSGGLAVEAADDAVVLRAELDAGDIFQT